MNKEELVEVYVNGGVMYYTKKYVNSILNYLEKWVSNKDIKLDVEWEEMSNEVSYINNLPLGEKVYISHVEVVYECGCVEQLSPDTSYMKGGKFEMVDGRIVYRIHENENCCNCGEVATIKTMAKPDSLLQQAIYSHGLATGFSGHKSNSDIKDSIMGVLSACLHGGEICCSWKTQQIGGIGLFVRGEVTLASNRDMWSSTNKNGERIFDVEDDRYLDNIITRKEELDLTIWDHTEFFIIPKDCCGVWVKDWFYQSNKDFVKSLMEEFHRFNPNLKLFITKRRHNGK